MAKPKAKEKTVAFPVPQSREECATLIAMIGDQRRALTVLEADMNAELEAVKARYQERAKGHTEILHRGILGVSAWCHANRDELTNGGKIKTHHFATGVVNWRLRPASVKLAGVKELVARLGRGALKRFLRVKYEVDKEALLRERDAARRIKGVTIVEGLEDFVITPSSTELDEVAD